MLHTFTRRFARTAAPAAALVTLLCVLAPAAFAGPGAEVIPDGIGNVESYMGCAIGLAVAMTPMSAGLAMLNCIRILLHEGPLA